MKNLKLSTACLIITLFHQILRPEYNLSMIIVSLLTLIGLEAFLEHRQYQKDTKEIVEKYLNEMKELNLKTYKDFAKVVDDIDKHQEERFTNMESRLSKLDYQVTMKPKKEIKPLTSGW